MSLPPEADAWWRGEEAFDKNSKEDLERLLRRLQSTEADDATSQRSAWPPIGSWSSSEGSYQVLKGKDGTLLFREGEGAGWLEGVLTYSTSTGWWEADVFSVSVPQDPAGDVGGTECGQNTTETRDHVGRFRVRLEQDNEPCAISQVLLFGVPGSEVWSEDNVVRAYAASSQRTPPVAMATNAGGGAAARASTGSTWPRESPDGPLAAVPEEEAPPQPPPLHPPLQSWQPLEKPPGLPPKVAASTPLGQNAAAERPSASCAEDVHQADQAVSRPVAAGPCGSQQPPAPPSVPPMPLAGPLPLPHSPLPAGSDPWTTLGSDPWSKGRSDAYRTEPPVAAPQTRRATDSSVAHRMIMSHLGSQRAERQEPARLSPPRSGHSTSTEPLATEGQRQQEKADAVSLHLRGTAEAFTAWLTQRPDQVRHRIAVLRKAKNLKLQVVREIHLNGDAVETAITKVEAAEASAAPASRDEPRGEWQERGWWSATGTWEWSHDSWGEWAKWQCEGGTWQIRETELPEKAKPTPEPTAVAEDPPPRAFQ
mmetsp:Transcript_98553/g.195492  ORF Transcript_98553/g.195492 Transcript_98553/m.195492 type:complete len:537 (+) Transcript_98553:66-1676(+)